MFTDGDDNNGQQTEQVPTEEPDAIPGEFNPGDDLTRAGEGHDPVEDNIT